LWGGGGKLNNFREVNSLDITDSKRSLCRCGDAEGYN